MRALVTGGDGYRGWPKVLYLSVQGCELSVAIERGAPLRGGEYAAHALGVGDTPTRRGEGGRLLLTVMENRDHVHPEASVSRVDWR